jgi:hypothetical protein
MNRGFYTALLLQLLNFFFYGTTAQIGPRLPLFEFLNHTQLDTHTPCRNSLKDDQLVAEAATYIIHIEHKRRKCLSSAEFKHGTPASKRLHTYALDRAANRDRRIH